MEQNDDVNTSTEENVGEETECSGTEGEEEQHTVEEEEQVSGKLFHIQSKSRIFFGSLIQIK